MALSTPEAWPMLFLVVKKKLARQCRSFTLNQSWEMRSTLISTNWMRGECRNMTRKIIRLISTRFRADFKAFRLRVADSNRYKECLTSNQRFKVCRIFSNSHATSNKWAVNSFRTRGPPCLNSPILAPDLDTQTVVTSNISTLIKNPNHSPKDLFLLLKCSSLITLMFTCLL